jgi:hypothetical protein
MYTYIRDIHEVDLGLAWDLGFGLDPLFYFELFIIFKWKNINERKY